MTDDNLAAILYGINDLRLKKISIEEPSENEVLIKMGCIGICGSDVHYLVNGKIGDFIVQQPMIMGHESSGTIVKVGKNVKNLKIGDRVAIEPGVPCRVCIFCKTGRYNLCEEIKFCATPPVHGSLCRYYKHAADFCYKLPDNVTLEEGALLEPLSVGVHACKRASVGIKSSVLILGAGPIGLVTLIAAKAMGARRVIIADLVNHRLNMANKLEADNIYLINNQCTENETIQNIQKLFGGQPDIVIDASGAEASIHLAVKVIKSGGNVVLVGMGSSEVKVPILNVLIKEIDMKGVFRYVNDYSDALELISKNKFNIGTIITHRFKLEEAIEAFETSKKNKDAVKVIIYCD